MELNSSSMDKILNKYIEEKCNRQEFIEAVTKLESKVPSVETMSFMKKHWYRVEEKEKDGNVNFAQILDRVHHDINLDDSIDTSIRWYSRTLLVKFGQRYAAIFLLAILISGLSFFAVDRYWGFGFDKTISAYAPIGQFSKLRLHDGTEVWLNSDSEFSYSSGFGYRNRTVNLKGEGYFKVAKNKSLPFIVKANGVGIEALGTQFNVEAYGEEFDMVKVTLEEGSVEVSKNNAIVILKPGEQAIVNGTSVDIRKDIATELYTAWHKGELIFIDASLLEISIQLEKMYGVNVAFKTENLKELHLRGKIKSERSIYHVLEVLKESAGIEYEIVGTDVYFY